MNRSDGGSASQKRRELSLDEYVEGVRSCDRAILGRAITLVESSRFADQTQVQDLLVRLLPYTGKSHRVGITGVPGVGKSTFIESLGTQLTQVGHRVAVLAVDPSSGVTGGSILGDKTRMNKLAADPNAFIRPSPSAGSLGGVTRRTRESMLVCEAAGFDVVLVETVGVGQSEVMVAEMVDCFLVLMLPGAGDELQGIKRGILEVADLVAVNKMDKDPQAARLAQQDYKNGLRILHAGHADAQPTQGLRWTPRVVTCSGLTGEGLAELWQLVEEHRRILTQSGELTQKRREQLLRWMWSMVESQLMIALREYPAVKERTMRLEQAVLAGEITPTLAAREILAAFGALSRE